MAATLPERIDGSEVYFYDASESGARQVARAVEQLVPGAGAASLRRVVLNDAGQAVAGSGRPASPVGQPAIVFNEDAFVFV
ncbi:hypothetical protein [Limimaricola sp.]|uniref:hypothetical protein n=1 Tax=Limimaricola sp. TaxID=2211665 RepID=UPI0040585EC8